MSETESKTERWCWTTDPDGCECWFLADSRDDALARAIGELLDGTESPLWEGETVVWLSPARMLGPTAIAAEAVDVVALVEWLADRLDVAAGLGAALSEMPDHLVQELGDGIRARVADAVLCWGHFGTDAEPLGYEVVKPREVRVRISLRDGEQFGEEIDDAR
jgi:hypothetical protein